MNNRRRVNKYLTTETHYDESSSPEQDLCTFWSSEPIVSASYGENNHNLSQPLCANDLCPNLLSGCARKRLVQRQADGDDRNVALCGRVLQESALPIQPR